MVLVPPQARPSGGTMLGNHEARIRILERRRSASGPRHVYGRMYDDATTLWAGSGDWSADPADNWITVTIDPPFAEGFACNVTPNDNGDTFLTQPDLQPVSVIPDSESGFVQVYQVDLATFRIMFWDLDGNKNVNRCGFDFEAVGT